ncbi:hypothetical protein UFOVP387_9 [uncultured Caudovirales phage]|uniref:Uncharacterized protein n=1 Tax=uncultured Caudovirales phage TaxID=2100421 RepID=A0A6J7X8V0_9CAUD|nr:hypothetical protein UFOVP387_9 [uncultured Caudovirales phage]
MEVISARSPFQIIVDEVGQTGSKVELFIWNKGTTEPTIPTYILSSNIASATQTETNYNISPYILEYINHIIPVYGTTPAVAGNNEWCFIRVKRYKNVSGAFTLLNNKLYLGVNAYTEVTDNLNYDIAQGLDFVLLGVSQNVNTKIQYYNNIPSFNFLCTSAASSDYRIIYYTASNVVINTNTFLSSGSTNYFNYKLPLAYNDSAYCEIESDDEGVMYRVYTEKIEECKYVPVNCTYVNKYGGWQQITFFKAQTNKIDIQSSKYNLMPSNVSYNASEGQKKSFNINGTQTITCNTGWVPEGYNNFIKELMLSDTILLNGNPVTIKTQSLQYKTNLLDKNINYTIDFEYSNSLINNVI